MAKLLNREGLPPADGHRYETRRAAPRPCPECLRPANRRVVVKAYVPAMDPGGEYERWKHPGWREKGWLESFFCPRCHEVFRLLNDRELIAAGQVMGGWKRL